MYEDATQYMHLTQTNKFYMDSLDRTPNTNGNSYVSLLVVAKAIRDGDIEILQNAFQTSPGTFTTYRKDFLSLLEIAVQANQLDVVKLFIKTFNLTEQLHWQNKYGDIPLNCAVRKGKLDMVKLLVNSGSTLNFLNNNQNSPLHVAAHIEAGGNTALEIISFLFQNGGWEYFTSAKNHNRKTACDLMQGRFGADIIRDFSERSEECKQIFNQNRFLNAALFNQIVARPRDESLASILEYTNLNGDTCLHAATKNRQFEVVKELLDRHAQLWQLFAFNRQMETPVFYAIEINCVPIVEWLIEHDFCHAPNHSNQLPLHFAARYGCYKIIETLLRMDLPQDISYLYQINSMNSQHETPLFESIRGRNSSEKTIKLLLSYGADSSMTNNKGQLPIHVAVEQVTDWDTQDAISVRIIKLLIEQYDCFYKLDWSQKSASSLLWEKNQQVAIHCGTYHENYWYGTPSYSA